MDVKYVTRDLLNEQLTGGFHHLTDDSMWLLPMRHVQ